MNKTMKTINIEMLQNYLFKHISDVKSEYDIRVEEVESLSVRGSNFPKNYRISGANISSSYTEKF